MARLVTPSSGVPIIAMALCLLVSAPVGCAGSGDAGEPSPTAKTTSDGATGPATETGNGTTGTTGETEGPSAEQDVMEAGATAIEITGDWLSAGAGAIWLSDPPSRRLYRLDPRSGETVGVVPVSQGPCAASDFGFGAVWTLTCEKPGLAKIDPSTNRVRAHVSLRVSAVLDEGEASVGVGAGAVWVVLQGRNCESCVLGRIDPRSLRVLSRIELREGAAAVRVGEGAVWVTNPRESVVQKIDPTRNRVVATTRVGPTPRFLAVGEGGAWTLNQEDGSVTRLDAATGAVAATIPAEVTGEGGDITTGGGFVWVRGRGYLLTRVDPKTNDVVSRYGPSSGSGAVIVGFGAVWISAHDVGTVWRLPLENA